MTVAELIAKLALDFEDRASTKVSKAAQELEAALRGINIEGAIKGDPFSKTYKYVATFRKQFKDLITEFSSGLDFKLKGTELPGTKQFISSISSIQKQMDVANKKAKELQNIISKASDLYAEFGVEGGKSVSKIEREFSTLAGKTEQVKKSLLNLKLDPSLSKEIKRDLIPSLDELVKAFSLGKETSKTAFTQAASAIKNLDLQTKVTLGSITKLINLYETLNKKTELAYKRKAISPIPVSDLTDAYSGLLVKLGQARSQLATTLGLLNSEFQYVPRIANEVRTQILSLAKAGYDLSTTEIKNIKKIVQYRDIELQSLQVRANLVRAGLASDQEVVDLIKKASLYSQRYNLQLKDVLATLNLSTKDWVSFYVESLKSNSVLNNIRSELDAVNLLLKESWTLGKSINSETLLALRRRQRELELEARLIEFENKRVYSVAEVAKYYDLVMEKARGTLGSDLDKNLKKALTVLADINVQLESEYNIESNLSKLRKVISESYSRDLEASQLIETFGLSRERIEQAIATAREQSIKSLQLQYELGLLNERSQSRLRDELLQQANLTLEQQLLLGKLNTALSSEESLYTRLINEQQKLNTLIESQRAYLSDLKTSKSSGKEIEDAQRVLDLMKERKKVVDEVVSRSSELADFSNQTVSNLEKEVRARVESERVLKSISQDKIKQLTVGIEELQTATELRARERQILDILKTVSKYISYNGVLTKNWKGNVEKLEKALATTRKILRSTESEASKTGSGLNSVSSALAGFFNLRLVGVFLLYRALWELRKVFTDLIRSSIELEDKMRKFETITLATTDAVEKATSVTLSLSKQYAVSATDIADALIKIGQAGYSATESINLINATTQLAVATGSELSDTVNLMLSAMQAWGLETSKASDVSNVFTSAINSTRLTVDRLNTSFNYITGIVPKVNITLEETAALLGTMADSGIRASTSGTSLRAMLAELIRPSSRLVNVLSNLGLTIEDVDPQLNTITEILAKLKKAGFSAADAFRAFGRRGASGIAVLVANAEKVGELSTSFNNYARSVSLAAIASESLQARLTTFWNSIKAGVSDIVPILTHFIDFMTGLRDIKFSSKDGIEFTKTLGEMILESQSADKHVLELTSSMRNFNQAVGRVKGLERAGLLIKALTEAYKSGLVPLSDYNSIMREYNKAINDNIDVTPILTKAQKILNDEVERGIQVERVRRILEFTDALSKQAEAARKLKKAYESQNKELAKTLKYWKEYPGIEFDYSTGVAPIPIDVKSLEDAIKNIQKLLGTPLKDEWLKSLKEQDTQLTGLTPKMSKKLYDFIKVVELAGPEFAKSFYESGKTLDDYRKSVANLFDVFLNKGKKLKDLPKLDLMNIKQIAEKPELFTYLASSMVKTAKDVDTLKTAFQNLVKEGIIQVTEGGAIDKFIELLNSNDVATKSLFTSISILQRQFGDLDKTIVTSSSNYKKIAGSLQDVVLTTLRYSQLLQKLNISEEMATAGVEDYTKKLAELGNVQKIQADRQKLLQSKQIFLISQEEAVTRLQLLEQVYNREVELAKGNANTIKQLNSWRLQQETKIYSDLSRSATAYERVIDDLVKNESSALQRLYSQLDDINVKLQENEANLEISLKSFDAAVRAKIDKLRGSSKSVVDNLRKEVRSIRSLIDEARLYSGEAKGKVYLKEAEQRLNALKSSFLSTTKLSEDQVRSLASRIKSLMKDLATVKDSVLEDQKTTIESQIQMMKKTLSELVNEMRVSTQAIKESLSKEGELKIHDNIDTELIPRFNSLIKKIVDANPNFSIHTNIPDIEKGLDKILDKLIKIKKNAQINFPSMPNEGKSVGGYVPGYGGGDIVPTWLEPGEFVIRKEVVRKLGLGFFRDVNEGIAFNTSFPKMQFGGVIPESKSRDVVNVNLVLGRTQFPLFGEREIVNTLISKLQEERLMTV